MSLKEQALFIIEAKQQVDKERQDAAQKARRDKPWWNDPKFSDQSGNTFHHSSYDWD